MNAGAMTTNSPNGIDIDSNGRIWIANAGSSIGADQVQWVQDLNMDGDANDAGEQGIYWDPGGTAELPQDVKVGADGNLYVLNIGSNVPKGIYALIDNDMNGTIDFTEVFPFYIPTPQPNTPFYWAMDELVDPGGGPSTWSMADTANECVWRAVDTDLSGSVNNLTEETKHWVAVGSSLIWSLVIDDDGTTYCAESQTPDRLLRLNDLDSNGFIDNGSEYFEIYDETISPLAFGNPRAIAFGPPSTPLGTTFCFGDGSDGVLCPCGNTPLAGSGEGCVHSGGVGAYLEASGSPTVGADTLLLTIKQGEPNEAAIFVSNNSVGAPFPFFDGAMCLSADATLTRHYFDLGGSPIPTILDPSGEGTNVYPLSLSDFNGLTVPGATIYYQAWMRSPLGPCGTLATSSAGIAITWF